MSGIGAFISNTEGIVKLGFVLGIGLVMLSKLSENSSITTTANSTIQNIITGLSEYGGWIGLIVLIVVGAYLLKKVDFK